MPQKEWRVRKTTVQELVVQASTREEAVQKADFRKGSKESQTTAAKLKPRELRSQFHLGVVEKGDQTEHIHDDGEAIALCGAKIGHKRLLSLVNSERLCKECEKLADERIVFKERRVI